MAIYYSPLAAKLNQEQLERSAPEAFDRTDSSEDKDVKSTPLLDY
jgi:hypothetical protein